MRTYLFAASIVLVACGPSTQKPTDATGEHTADTATAETSAPAETAAPDATTSAAPSSAPAASASSAPAAPETAKDANALVIELTVEGGKSGLPATEIDALKKEFEKLVAKSSKISMSAKGVDKPRHVNTRLVVPAIDDAKGTLAQKLQIVGVTADGKCPLFDLGGQASMSGGKKDNKDDVLAVRAAAIAQVFQKLENEAPTLKPAQSCTPEDKKKK